MNSNPVIYEQDRMRRGTSWIETPRGVMWVLHLAGIILMNSFFDIMVVKLNAT